MKLSHTLAVSILAVAGLTSCEMKNELIGNGSEKAEMGTLELTLAVKEPAANTRAVSTDNFPVSITGTSTAGNQVEMVYDNASEVPSSIRLEVGTYTVEAHTPGELQKQMSAPYYGGSTEMTISQGITVETTVTCRMKNSKIQMKYGDDFLQSFREWTITVDDGTNSVLTYTNENLNPDAVYWHFEEGKVATITVNITAVTTAGNQVRESRQFKKADAAENYEEENEFFNGGDALDINMGTVASATGSVTGIDITTNITFENTGETVEIPTEGEKEEKPDPTPDPGEGTGAVTLTLPADVTYSANDPSTQPASADANIYAKGGFQSIVVTIKAGNAEFGAILADLAMDGQSFLAEKGGVNIVDNSDFNGLLTTVALPNGPSEGNTEYTFPIGVFFQFLNMTGATDQGTPHEFHIVVTDLNGETAEGTFKVTITE